MNVLSLVIVTFKLLKINKCYPWYFSREENYIITSFVTAKKKKKKKNSERELLIVINYK